MYTDLTTTYLLFRLLIKCFEQLLEGLADFIYALFVLRVEDGLESSPGSCNKMMPTPDLLTLIA
jgi:hypothetical protein